ncbi:MAG: S9 family peptidase [Prevotellaceae bacterium]|jgi:dipeptidyl-peptidase-4|nr:S9 family peptidase [Prevotellaceae bacterium]
MKRIILASLIALFATVGTVAQDKVFTMEDAVFGYHLRPQSKYLVWQGSSNSYTYTEEKNLVSEDIKGVKKILMTVDELNPILNSGFNTFPSYSWMDENTLKINYQGREYRVDAINKTLKNTVAFPEAIENLTYSEAGKLYAYTVDNNLFYMNEQGDQFTVTDDKDKNIINGQTVSRNEFGINGGIFWSPDGKKLAFYRKDESRVATFPLLDITTRTGSVREIKYPMAGMASEQITLGVYDIATKQTCFLNVADFDRDRYLTNITWSPLSDIIYVQVLNRGQDHLRLNKYEASTGKFIATLFEEKSDTYIEPQHPLRFLDAKGEQFIYTTNNRDGYFSLYLHNAADGKLIKRLTPVNADVQFVAADRAGKNLYYLSAEVSPVEEHLFQVNIKTGKSVRLTSGEGWHRISMSRDCSCFIDSYSSLNVPGIIEISDAGRKNIRRILEAKNPFSGYAVGEITLGTVKSDDGYDLYYRLIKPAGFDSARKYPVITYVYGGPHSQLVRNNWTASSGLWEIYMAQRGYVVFVMDNHGTGNRGRDFENAIHRQCGQREMADQIKGIEFLKSKPWVDADRIGVHGWSYGGFMTISLITNYPDIYKVAVAGGPVIDWKWYEVMYGERYMDTPEENPDGYSKTSLINKAKDLKGKLLICHGLVDPVVVIEHSLSFVRECIKNNVQVDYFPYPLAEHNVGGKDRIHLKQKITNYFDDYLKNVPDKTH